MPTYEYECENCGNKLEDFRTISKRDEKTICSKCNSIMIRIISATKNYILRGEGFYENDYKGDK